MTKAKKSLKTGYWTIEVMPNGGYAACWGFGTTRQDFACSTMNELMQYILKHARGL